MQSIAQSIPTRFVLGGTVAAGMAYTMDSMRKETEMARKEAESARREAESAHHKLELQSKESECQRREMESMRREYDAKLEGKSSKWSWFW